MRILSRVGPALVALALLLPAPASASPANVAALQSALTAIDLYRGHVDGIRGPLTRRAIVSFQRRRDLLVDGLAGRQTKRALGWRGRPRLGSRAIHFGQRGWDVAALQFLLQRGGYGPGRADGLFGPLTDAAVRRAQRAGRITIDGFAGSATLASLRGKPASAPGSLVSGPVRFLRPVAGPIGDGFGAPRSDHRHQGIDFPVPYGTRVGAAGVGTTIFAGYNTGGYGNLVVIQHRLGFTSWYAHLSSVTSWAGEQVSGGTRIGYVGSTGNSTGPHLHFEVRRYNSPINPLPLLLDATASSLPTGGAPPNYSECANGRDPRKPTQQGDWIAREPLC